MHVVALTLAGRVLQQELAPMTHSSSDPDRIAERLPLLRRRAQMVQATRKFFDDRGYLDVDTPYAVPVPGEEVHLRCFRTELEHADGSREVRFLHTSPEFAMKRIIAATGLPIFQLARVWRNGEMSATHVPEFTMLEWYAPGADLDALMDETEDFVRALLPDQVYRDGVLIPVTEPFERLTMQDAFARYVRADLLETAGDAEALARQAKVSLRDGESWEDLFFRLLLERIEPVIGRERPTFLTHWPAEQAALAKRDPADKRAALRFELYIGGIELANAFEELTDPVEQRQRFEADRQRRLEFSPDQDWPLDKAFLTALPDMPSCSGIALGFDRLVLLATGAPKIRDILWLGQSF
ncbi:lysyl-tRNA synthetase [Gluconobacter thailandicus F149-1 = NBRC 100600]|uniref:Lysyl-tRNA synthetase n=2 Tax=Gluconobacter thailandicus TaxID=257438 RepID=A0ABQ0IT26_GLUTH|nr:lysyl-tRNA synthetase [Gluconobacter thailandicus NBRC 3255]GAD25337.1 lysyl-tRNA synthetase [Gluconobacter thailandicus NBRC 3257]GAN92008.1 lysyl-tRNA synthetase [Gluconobacter thailandicus F149-1 = NBRC 100600]GBR60483.1 lysyl-tRNA synthetase [Gluconobacter thailandicus F149-1 = NBRC 100600]GEL86085.1 EF-P lysine aminoacylase GenX [Gluconobacter thailandicus F149-1 = NBRC 100600]